ncbi:unnamed protein product [Strongylus vulgaris]|uniref:Cysteine rich repeat-containing domain protein n=1 Tax=Strongylus vulgaris TaxID=40348 RepID=A0A3P7L598_STRVU|nr:unnamed protein product [Strongylus vulgaris]
MPQQNTMSITIPMVFVRSQCPKVCQQSCQQKCDTHPALITCLPQCSQSCEQKCAQMSPIQNPLSELTDPSQYLTSAGCGGGNEAACGQPQLQPQAITSEPPIQIVTFPTLLTEDSEQPVCVEECMPNCDPKCILEQYLMNPSRETENKKE